MGLESVAKPFGGIFKASTVIEIPKYQRGFSWRNENITRLWDDLMDAMSQDPKTRTLFLGSVVFSSEDDATNLVDGQQRLTTLSLILAAVRHRLKEVRPETNQRGKLLNRLEDLTLVDGDESGPGRLSLSKRDNAAFQEFVLKGKASGAPGGLRRAWNTINKRLDEELRQRTLDEIGKGISDLARDTVHFSVVTVSPPYNPFTVFEALNSTGQDLAQSDLIKNRVLQRASEKSQDSLHEKWEKLAAELPEGEVTNYLRAWWISQEGFVSTKELYQAVKSRIKTPADAEAYIGRWLADADKYVWILEGKPVGGSQELRRALMDFRDLGFRQGRPIVLGFLLAEGKPQLRDVVHELSRIYVRVLKTAQQRGSKFEAQIESITSATLKAPTKGLEQLRKVANQLINETKALDWSSLHVDDLGFARYLLTRIAAHQEGKNWSAPPELEIEHILPRVRPAGYLPQFSEEDYQRQTTHIGNLTLVLNSDNAQLSNKVFDSKKGVYGDPNKKHLKMTASLAHMVSFGPDEIKARAAELAKIAEVVWPPAG